MFIISLVAFVIQTCMFLHYDGETKKKIIPWRTFYFYIMCKKNSIYELEEKLNVASTVENKKIAKTRRVHMSL